MTDTPSLPDQHAAIVAEVSGGNLASLTGAQRALLAAAYLHERSSGAFALRANEGDESQLQRWLVHYCKIWAPTERHYLVVDYGRRILETARKGAGEPHPIVAVVLYATWVEHWLNSMLLGVPAVYESSDADRESMLRQPINVKLGWLWLVLGLPTVEPPHLNRLVQLINVRNRYVHYKWNAVPAAELDGGTKDMKDAIEHIEATIKYVTALRLNSKSGSSIADAERLFSVSLAATLLAAYDT